MKFPQLKKSIQINGKEICLETGRFAFQANGAVLAKMGDTQVLATVTSSDPKEGIDYFPLYVEYQEKLYAGGKIKGSRWVKREGRPSDEAILTARLIDRSVRPLFPQGYKDQVQLVVTVLSVDGENDPEILSICAASAALAISDIPWNGPIGGVRVGLKDDNLFTNPVYQELEFSDLDLVVSATKEEIIMIEAGSNEVSEEKIIAALKHSQEPIKKIIDFITDFQKEAGQAKKVFKTEVIEDQLEKEVIKTAGKEVKKIVEKGIKKADFSDLEAVKEKLIDQLEDYSQKEILKVVDNYFKKLVREQVLEKKVRIDGRKIDQIRELKIETKVLPRTHGSAVFQRGLTQALTITTLGSPSLEQWIEHMEREETKRYIHHYYMPPYSVGEVGRFGWPSRREVGHGALAERALEPVLPAEEKFPYTIRVVSEIMSSNGSTSMASVCGSSLSLMDAGVPIKKPVAGIAMGLVGKGKEKRGRFEISNYLILTDILGVEDHLGDMDFKVAGTKEGITALQMDVKTLGITPEILAEGLDQAKKARLYILEQMAKSLPTPRASVSQYAPKVAVLEINKEKIGQVIGPGGKTIREITDETGVAMDIDDEGVVTISGKDKEEISRAISWVEGLTREVQPGEKFVGQVKRIQPFGAFVEILPGKEGLVHVSKMAKGFVKKPEDIVQVGQEVEVKVIDIDDRGRISLTMLLEQRPPRPGKKRKNRSSKQKYSYEKRF